MIAHPSWIEINIAQFRRNIAAIRRRIHSPLLCLPVKANAYGHGLIPMAMAAQEAGVDMLAVSCLKEGIELRREKIGCPIFVFGAIHEEQIDDLIDYQLEFSISSRFKAELVQRHCRGRTCRVHLEVDTGIQRTGVRPTTAVQLFDAMRTLPCFEIAGIYSHLATADHPDDPFAKAQIAAFSQLKSEIRAQGILWHLANSGGVQHYPDSHLDMVRPGLLCYGLTPDGREDEEILPCFSLKARISYFKVVGAGVGISYGHLYRTRRETRIVTVPVGYGDGYPRNLSKDAAVLIRGHRYPIAGRVCMDQLMVDIGLDEAYVGDEVTLVGKQGAEAISLWDLARAADTDPRDLLCRFNERIPRVYRE